MFPLFSHPQACFLLGVFSEFLGERERERDHKSFQHSSACCFLAGWQRARAEAHLRLAPALLWLSAFNFWLAVLGPIP